jgi:membrane protease YdiL (CAAX protease family)
MIGVIVLFAISWLVIWFFEKGNLSVLGLLPGKNISKLAVIVFFTTSLCCASGYLIKWYYSIELYQLNPDLSSGLVLKGLKSNFISVLTEELFCRGVGLYILLKKLGTKWGILISSVVFGVLHWFNAGVWGNISQMAMLFSFTFVMGLLLANAFVRTGSILVPLAIHLGWNLTQNFIFPDGPFGGPLLVKVLPLQPEVTVSYFVFFMVFLFPELSAILLDFAVIKKYPVQKHSGGRKYI